MSKSKKTEDDEILKTVDMYPVKSRWDAILFIAFIIAFLIFVLALLAYPQIA